MTLYEIHYRFRCMGFSNHQWNDGKLNILGLNDAKKVIEFVESQIYKNEQEIGGIVYPVSDFQLVSIIPICTIDGVIPELQSGVVNATDGE